MIVECVLCRRGAQSDGGMICDDCRSKVDKPTKTIAEYAEFDCEGCGAHVYHYSLSKPPKHMFCATCLWLNETDLSAEEFWLLYKQICASSGDSR